MNAPYPRERSARPPKACTALDRPPLFPPTQDEFLPRSLLQDPEFSARIKREAHLMRNQAIRDALAALARWIIGKAQKRR